MFLSVFQVLCWVSNRLSIVPWTRLLWFLSWRWGHLCLRAMAGIAPLVEPAAWSRSAKGYGEPEARHIFGVSKYSKCGVLCLYFCATWKILMKIWMSLANILASLNQYGHPNSFNLKSWLMLQKRKNTETLKLLGPKWPKMTQVEKFTATPDMGISKDKSPDPLIFWDP